MLAVVVVLGGMIICWLVVDVTELVVMLVVVRILEVEVVEVRV